MALAKLLGAIALAALLVEFGPAHADSHAAPEAAAEPTTEPATESNTESSTQPATESATEPVIEPTLENARAFMGAGRFDLALIILRHLAANPPPDADFTDIHFLIGLSAIAAAQLVPDEEPRNALLDEAIQALLAILADRPELVRVRLELARAFFLKGEDQLSRRHFEQVLAGDPAPPVVANINRFLAEIRARRRWTFRAGGAIAPDTNIGAVSDSEIIYIFGLPFQRSAADLASSGLGVVGWGGGEYQYPLHDRLRLRAGADAYHREYPGGRFDQSLASVHLGPRWLIAPRTEGSVLATVQRQWFGGPPYSDTVGGRVELEHQPNGPYLVGGNIAVQTRTFADFDYLDGPLFSASVFGVWAVAPTVRLDGAVGYRRERTESEQYRNATRWLRADASVALPLGFTFGVGGELHWSRYQGDWSFFTQGNPDRADRLRIARVSLFNRRLTIFGISPQLVLVNEARQTNAQLYDYKRNRAELRFQRQF